MIRNLSTQGFSEEAFVHRLQAGERAAFAELYDRYGRNLYAVIYEIVQSEVDAENLLQDTFVKIWRNISRYDASKGRLYTWLLVIARRLALDFMRSNYFSEKQMTQNVDAAVYIESADADMAKLDYIGVGSAVERLDPPLREVIRLQYYLGYTQQEVADETGLPLGTVKSRTRAALLRLREQLAT